MRNLITLLLLFNCCLVFGQRTLLVDKIRMGGKSVQGISTDGTDVAQADSLKIITGKAVKEYIEGLDLSSPDTTLLATRSFLSNTVYRAREVEVYYYANSNVSSIVLPDTPDSNYPVKVLRMGAYQSVDRDADTGRDWLLQGSTVTPKYRAVLAGETIIIFYTKQQ